MGNEEKKELSLHPNGDRVKEAVGYLISAVLYLGGPVSGIIAGRLSERKMERIADFLRHVADDLKDFRSEVSEQYVQTDEFEELFEHTAERVMRERTEAKRAAFRRFIVKSIKTPGKPYDRQIQLLKILEDLHEQHLALIRGYYAGA
jgi:pyruvate-formate lyase-activating enzyme